MSRTKGKSTPKRIQPTRRPQPAKIDRQAPLVEQIADGVASAIADLGPGGLPEFVPTASDHDPDELSELWRQATRVRAAYQEALNGLERRTAELGRQVSEFEVSTATLDARRRELEQDEDRLSADRTAFAERLAAVDERDRKLLDGEIALHARQEREREEIIAAARAELSSVRERVEEVRMEFDRDLTRQRERLRADLAAERAAFDEELASLREERHRLRKWDGELRIREEDLQDSVEMYEDRTKLAVAASTEDLRLQVDHLRRQYQAARDDSDQQSKQIVEYQRLRRALEDRDPEDVREELDRLRADSAELRRLQLTPPAETDLRLSALEEEARHLRDRCATYAADNERMKRQLSAYEITATSLERLTVGKDALEAEVRAYRDIIEEEERKWEGLVARREGSSPLPMCTEMDTTHADPPSDLADAAPPLPELVRRVRMLIRQQHGLFYEETDLRSFLAGLATSQLHLLQGISGIGKTQLPQRFAEAIGAASAVVSVGADWRSPQDLMGYYNAFERRFYESEFTKALYRAQCPAFADQPYLIVLDEMNLSHPEQYFNDVLSALERDGRRSMTPDLVLMSAAVSPSPRLLREGRLLPVPRSVFFVGTANHDETTVSFADKTYDRAHVMELPASPRPFDIAPQDPLAPLSFRALTTAFDEAVVRNRPAADEAQRFFDTVLAARMATDFRVSWGSRLRHQIGRYVPVVVAAGGSPAEATDHLIATKVLRKLRGRYEIRVDQLKKLRDDLVSSWPTLEGGAGASPRHSVAMLDGLVRDMGQQ